MYPIFYLLKRGYGLMLGLEGSSEMLVCVLFGPPPNPISA